MLNQRIFYKLFDLVGVLAFFLTPLLFFVQNHDQFELPKLTFLILLTIPLLAFELKEKNIARYSPLAISLVILFLFQALSCLPSISLSWRTSLLGDYENFAGLTTLVTYGIWFFCLSRLLNESKIEKIFYFNTLTAFFSSLYAIGQHFQFDFIQWNAESINPSREFAALGNPNFLSAYLAMSIPLFLSIASKQFFSNSKKRPFPSFFYYFLLILGVALVLLGTYKVKILFNLNPSPAFGFTVRTLGLLSLSLALIRFSLFEYWQISLLVMSVIGLGLFSTASRGGFLAAVLGIGLWFFLAARKNNFAETLREKIKNFSKLYFFISSAMILFFFIFFGQSFLSRLLNSIIHFRESLAVSRLHIWRPAIEIIKANPWFGVGLDTFKIAFPYYSGIGFNQIDGMFMSSRMAHNELLQIAATTGLLGLAAYLGILICFLRTWLKLYHSSNSSSQWYLIAILASALAYHIQNLFSFGVASLNILWFFFLACVQNFYRKSLDPPASVVQKGFIFYFEKIITITLIILIFIFPLRRLAADIAYGHGNVYSDAIKSPDSRSTATDINYYSDTEIDYLSRAVRLFPYDVKYHLYLGLAYEQRARIDVNNPLNWYVNALNNYQNAVLMSPANGYYYNNEGRVYTALSAADPSYLPKAEEAFQKSVEWSPSSPFFILNWASSLEKTGRIEEAKKETQKAFDLDSSFTAKVLSQMAFENYRSGDKAKAFEYLNEALQGNTSSAEAYYCRGIIYLSEKEKKKALEDFETVKSLRPDPFKNSSIQSLDQFIEQAKN